MTHLQWAAVAGLMLLTFCHVYTQYMAAKGKKGSSASSETKAKARSWLSSITKSGEERATEAVIHLLAARSLQPTLPESACSSLLPATVASLILERLQKAGYAPFEAEAVAPSGARLQLQLVWNGWRGTY